MVAGLGENKNYDWLVMMCVEMRARSGKDQGAMHPQAGGTGQANLLEPANMRLKRKHCLPSGGGP